MAAVEAAAALVGVGEELPDSKEPAASGPDLASPNPNSEEPVDADLALASPDPGSEELADADSDLAIPSAAVGVGETLSNFEASSGAAVVGEAPATPNVHLQPCPSE